MRPDGLRALPRGYPLTWHADGVGNPAPEPPARLTRRAALALLVGAGVVACSPTSDAGPTPSPTADPDAQTRAEVAAQEWALVALYDAAIAAQPAQAAELSLLRDQHVEHATALGSSTASASATATGPAPDRATLTAAEEEASRSRVTACARAVQPDLARLLALIGASEAGHAAFLRGRAS